MDDMRQEDCAASVSHGLAVNSLGDWVDTYEMDGNGTLTIKVQGKEEDLLWDDDVGSATAGWSRTSAPPWGIGAPREMRSAKGTYSISYSVESENSDY